MYYRTTNPYIPYHYIPYYGTFNRYFPYYIASAARHSFSPVDPTLFNQSAIAMQKLFREASIVLNRLADSKTFAFNLMTAAQESKTDEVDRLIKSTGITSNVTTTYNPDGINLVLSSKVGETECCKLTIALRWR